MSAVAFLRRPSLLAVLTFSFGIFAQGALAEDYVCFDTNHGDICFDLYPESAPLTVANFLRYVDRGAYDTTLVHRSMPGFVIQGGGFSGEPIVGAFGVAIPVDAPIITESRRSNLRGTLAMAHTSMPNSATSQWFINLVDNTGLNGTSSWEGYAVFGEVVQGMDVVDRIAALPIIDFSQDLGDGFGNMPVDVEMASAAEIHIDPSDFVVVERAYRTERLPGMLPYQCSLTSPGDTLTEFCGSTVTFPVLVDGVLYEATLQYVSGREGLVFSVDRSKLKGIADTGQERATFAAGVLTLPSLRNGARAFTNVRLNLTSTNPLEFKVDSFTPR